MYNQVFWKSQILSKLML